jgi:hypothetical protein
MLKKIPQNGSTNSLAARVLALFFAKITEKEK